jgi:hypothetical protein
VTPIIFILVSSLHDNAPELRNQILRHQLIELHAFLRTLPFAVAEVLLLWGVLRLRPVAFIGSFVVLVVACVYSVASEGSSAVFSFIGLCVIVFAVTCIALGERLGGGRGFVSRSGLRAIGAVLFFLGVAGLLVL